MADMGRRRPWWLVATVLWLGCGTDDSSGEGTSATSDTGSADTGPAPDDGPSDESGSIDESGVGMDDDMPLVTSIPDIKQGNVALGTAVELYGVIPTTVEFGDGSTVGAMVQDPEAATFGGLRLRSAIELGTPSPGNRVDLFGVVERDSRFGLLLRVELFETRGAAVPPAPISTSTSRIGPGGTLRQSLADMVVQLAGPTGQGLRVVASGDTPQSFVLDDDVVVDLAPFGVDVPTPTRGTQLMEVGGVLVLDGARSLVWPRTADDIVPAG